MSLNVSRPRKMQVPFCWLLVCHTEAGLPRFSSLRRKPHKPLFKVFLVLTI